MRAFRSVCKRRLAEAMTGEQDRTHAYVARVTYQVGMGWRPDQGVMRRCTGETSAVCESRPGLFHDRLLVLMSSKAFCSVAVNRQVADFLVRLHSGAEKVAVLLINARMASTCSVDGWKPCRP